MATHILSIMTRRLVSTITHQQASGGQWALRTGLAALNSAAQTSLPSRVASRPMLSWRELMTKSCLPQQRKQLPLARHLAMTSPKAHLSTTSSSTQPSSDSTATNSMAQQAASPEQKLHDQEIKRSNAASEERKGEEKQETLWDKLLTFTAYGLLSFVVVKGIYTLLEFPEPCRVALKLASEHEIVQRFIGLPLKPSYLWHGTVKANTANVVIPVTGPKGEGVIHARLLRHYEPQQEQQQATQTQSTQSQQTGAAPTPGQQSSSEQQDQSEARGTVPSQGEPVWMVMTLHCQVPQLGMRMTDIMPPTPFDEEESKIINELLQQHPITMPPAAK